MRAQTEQLQRAIRIANDEGEVVDFKGETKENFIRLFQSAYPIMNRMTTTLDEGASLLSEVRQALKPQKLFLTWMRYTGMPEKTAFNYLRVYDRFGPHLPELSHLGIERLLIASSARNCAEYVKNNEQTIAEEPPEALLKKIRELRAEKKEKPAGRPRR